MKTYEICEAKTGNILIKSINLPEDQVENLSSDSSEGFFMSDSLDELAELGSQAVYAIIL